MARYTPPTADPARIAALESKSLNLTHTQRLALTPSTALKVLETDTGQEVNYVPGLGWRTGAGLNPDATTDTGVY